MSKSVAKASLHILFLSVIFLAHANAHANECREQHERASEVCNEALDSSFDFSVGAGHFEAFQKAKQINDEVTRITNACVEAVNRCWRACDRYAYAEEAMMGYDHPSVRLSNIQLDRCRPNGELHLKSDELARVNAYTFSLLKRAQANFELTNAIGGRQPAQVIQIKTVEYEGQSIHQSVPESLNYTTHPGEVSRQIEKALESIK